MGYEENHLGWHVRDLNGHYFFSCDIFFNENIHGHLGHNHTISSSTLPTFLTLSSSLPHSSQSSLSSHSSHSSLHPSAHSSLSPPPPLLVHLHQTIKLIEAGCAYLEDIHQHNEWLMQL